jgi:hypothetical protein
MFVQHTEEGTEKEMDIAGIALVHGLVQGAGMITDLDLNQKGMELMKIMGEFVTCCMYRPYTSRPSCLSLMCYSTYIISRFSLYVV